MSDNLNISSDLNNYIRIKIGECSSKEEEDSYVSSDVQKIKLEIKQPKQTMNKIWELILRIIYAEMLGHNTEFAHSFVVIAVQNPSYRVKRIAYLACSLLLDSESAFRILVVASLQKDLASTCLYNKIIALNSIGMLMCKMNVSAFLDCVTQELNSPHLVVKRKALLCYIRMKELLSDNLSEITLDFEHQYLQTENQNVELKKGELSMVLTALGFYKKAVGKFLPKYKKLWKLFNNIIEQLFSRNFLSEDYEYEGYHCPWAIIWTLQIIGKLCENDPGMTMNFLPLLHKVLESFQRIETDIDCSILFQIILTSLKAFPTQDLIQKSIEKFELIRTFSPLKHESRQLLELRIIERLISIDKTNLENYQIGVIDCLESFDETVRSLAIEVLFKAIQEHNCNAIVDKIQMYIATTTNPKLKTRAIEKLLSVLEMTAPQPDWYVQQAWKLLINGDTHISQQMLARILFNMNDLAESLQESVIPDYVANSMILMSSIIEEKSINTHLAEIFAWFVGQNILVLHVLKYSYEQMLELLEFFEGRVDLNSKAGVYDAMYKLKIFLQGTGGQQVLGLEG